jgi:hypothetical protein
MTANDSGLGCRLAKTTAAPARVGRQMAKAMVVAFALALLGGRVQAMSNIQCEIRSRPVNNGVELTGVVWAEEGAQGDYRFAVSSEGSGGSSNVVQSGFFVLRPHEPRVVGSVVVNSGSGSSFAARLSVQAETGELCSADA